MWLYVSWTIVLLGCEVALASGVASAQDAKKGEAAAKEAGCLTCHTVAKKKIGPALKERAAAFKKDGADADKIVATVKSKHSELKAGDDDLKNIAAWLLTL